MSVKNEPRGFVRWLSRLIAEDIQAAIIYQRFKANYDPLSRAYLKRKAAKGWSLDFWIATGLLLRSLRSYWSQGKWGYVVDFSRAVYPDTDIPIRRVARWLEYGTSRGIPARPVFKPVLNSYRRRITRLRKFFRGD